LPAAWKVQVPLCVGCRTSGLGTQDTPVVVLKTIWWASVSLLVNWTLSPAAMLTDFGT
jgi:hypothetical protein